MAIVWVFLQSENPEKQGLSFGSIYPIMAILQPKATLEHGYTIAKAYQNFSVVFESIIKFLSNYASGAFLYGQQLPSFQSKREHLKHKSKLVKPIENTDIYIPPNFKHIQAQ